MIRSDEGYTLLELVVAVAIVAMVAAPLALSIESGIYSWRTTHDAISVQERDLLVRERLRVWLSSAYPHDVNRQTDIRHYPMTGSESSVTFVSSVHPDPKFDVLYSISLSVADGDLKAQISPDFTSYTADRVYSEATLLSGVSGFELTYLDRETNPSNPTWVGEWQDRFYLPAAVRIKLSFLDSRRVWPDLIADTIVEEWSHCAFDEVSRKCRTGADAG